MIFSRIKRPRDESQDAFLFELRKKNLKQCLPPDHGLSEAIRKIKALLPESNGLPSLTSIQFEALDGGIAHGKSMLVCAPTSTGKTLIGWWAIASAIERGERAIYLVSHRALAKQKFEEAERLFLETMLENDRSAIVCATGDGVEDASGRKTSAPLSTRILIATYEKFLGCMSVGGPPHNLTDTTFVCDEVQLVGDRHRGQNVELLLTLMRRAGWRQLVGLSAVLGEQDAKDLADWLGVSLLRNPTREKALRIQCRTSEVVVETAVAPNLDGGFEERRDKLSCDLEKIVKELLQSGKHGPVIVFCMKVDDTYEHSKTWAARQPAIQDVAVPQGLEIDAELRNALCRRTAFHNAELDDDERTFVEDCLARQLVDVVFATSTLAAGVNFPLGSAVFASWTRWNFDRKRSEPIGKAEFQNMAGRVGRMGQVQSEGLVILTADRTSSLSQARLLMNFEQQDDLGDGISPDDFGPLTLQLFAGKLCVTRDDAFHLIASTLSANREASRGRGDVAHWRIKLEAQISRLVDAGCLVESQSRLTVTTFGIAVARSGLKPETANFFIERLVQLGQQLTTLLPTTEQAGQEDGLLFLLAHAALLSPEYNLTGGKATRQINWRVTKPGLVSNSYGCKLERILFEKPLLANPAAANGALLIVSCAAGILRSNLERLIPGVRMGTIQALARDVAWILTGVSEVISATTSPTLAEEAKPAALRGDGAATEAVRQLARGMRRQAARINLGLPSDVLWMSSLDLQFPERRRLSRSQILALRAAGLTRPMDLMDGGKQCDQSRRTALGAVENAAIANRVRDAARRWKISDREHSRRNHNKRAERAGAASLIHNLYEAKGEALEDAFQAVIENVEVKVERLDKKGRQAYPDFLITIENYAPIVVEIKSKQADNDLITLNAATEVLSASELIGMRNNTCLTVCSPGVEPGVPGIVEGCGRLCVVEIADLAEALIRLIEGLLTRAGLYNWLTTPGMAIVEDLPPPN